MDKLEELDSKLKPLLKELVFVLDKNDIPFYKILPGKAFEVLIKKQGTDIPFFEPKKCTECGYQKTYADWDDEERTYFCPECGEPQEYE